MYWFSRFLFLSILMMVVNKQSDAFLLVNPACVFSCDYSACFTFAGSAPALVDEDHERQTAVNANTRQSVTLQHLKPVNQIYRAQTSKLLKSTQFEAPG